MGDLAVRRGRRAVSSTGSPVEQLAEAVAGPLGVRLLGTESVLQLGVAAGTPCSGDTKSMSPGPSRPRSTLPWPADVDGAHLRAAHDEAVVADRVAQGTQTVAVEHRADADAVGEDRHRPGRPTAPSGRSGTRRSPRTSGSRSRVALPRLGHHHGDRVAARVRPPRTQQLDGLVELARVGVALDRARGRKRASSPSPAPLGAEHAATAHAVGVAVDRVDLAVVAEQCRNGCARSQVGRVLVENRWWKTANDAVEAVVGQVEVEVGQGVGGDQALVDDGAERARHHVGTRERGAQPPPEPVGRPLVALGAGVRRLEHRLHQLGSRGSGDLAQGARIGGGVRQSTTVSPSDVAASVTACPGIRVGPGIRAAHHQHGHAGARHRRGRGGSG